MFLGYTSIFSQHYDEPYEFRDGFEFWKALIDSSGQLYFFGRNDFAVVDEQNRTWEIIDTFETSEKKYEIEYIIPEFTHFGENIKMTSFGTKDSSYFCFFNDDTTIVYNALQISSKFDFKNTTGYNNHKFWFSGFWGNIYTFDDRTLKLDSLPLDSVHIHKWNLGPANFLPYDQGFLYLGHAEQKIYYYSDQERWTIDVDSIIDANNLTWLATRRLRISGDTLLFIGPQQRIAIFNLITHDFEVIDLSKTSLIEYHPDVVISDGKYLLEPDATFDGEGNIYVSIYTLKKGIVKYKRIDSYNYEHLEHEGFKVVYRVQNSGRNSTWLSGIFEENGQTYSKVVEYIPNGNSVEAFPSIVPIKVFPNPAKTYTNVKFYLKPSTRASVDFTIYNYMGQLIKNLDDDIEYDPNSGFATKRINTISLKTGIYYLVVDNEVEKRMFGFAVE